MSANLVFDHPTPAAVARYLIPIAMPDAVNNGDRPSEEDQIRAVLASIPIGRLRKAGLLDALVELARGDQHDTSTTADAAGSIDEMDAEALIRMTEGDVA